MTDQDKTDFAAALNRLCIALRDKEPDVVQMRVYFDGLKDLDVELVTAAADRLGKLAEYFPKVADWRAMALRVERERREQLGQIMRERRLAGLPPICGECDDTGFAPLAETNRYARCECVKLRRLELLGRRPMPALPEARELNLAEATAELTSAVARLAAIKAMP
jgi:hypothetical protein